MRLARNNKANEKKINEKKITNLHISKAYGKLNMMARISNPSRGWALFFKKIVWWMIVHVQFYVIYDSNSIH